VTIILPQPNQRPRPPATVLQGPADADAFRVKVGRYRERFYCDPLPACDLADATDESWPSVSKIKGAKPFEGANYVAMKRIANGIVDGSFTAQAADGFDALYERFKSADKLGLMAAGNRGTHVHKMAEQMLYGLPVTEDGPGAEYRGALEDFFAAYQPELVAAEVVCIKRKRYGGTADAIVKLNDGGTYLIDWKSRDAKGDHNAYPEEGAQLAAYLMADYIIVQDGETAKRAPFPDVDGILILSIKPDGVKVYPVDRGQAVSYWAELHRWYMIRQTENLLVGKPWPIKRALTTPDLPAEILDAGDPKRLPTVAQVKRALTPAAGVVAKSAPKVEPPIEGEPADPAAVAALQARFKALPEAEFAALKKVAGMANAAGVPISVAQCPSVRRFEIARMLMAWAAFSTPLDDTDPDVAEMLDGEGDGAYEVLRNVLALVGLTDALQPAVTIGNAVGHLATDEAMRATSIFDQLSAKTAALSLDATGAPALLAA
jgi:hypothetical protein